MNETKLRILGFLIGVFIVVFFKDYPILTRFILVLPAVSITMGVIPGLYGLWKNGSPEDDREQKEVTIAIIVWLVSTLGLINWSTSGNPLGWMEITMAVLHLYSTGWITMKGDA